MTSHTNLSFCICIVVCLCSHRGSRLRVLVGKVSRYVWWWVCVCVIVGVMMCLHLHHYSSDDKIVIASSVVCVTTEEVSWGVCWKSLPLRSDDEFTFAPSFEWWRVCDYVIIAGVGLQSWLMELACRDETKKNSFICQVITSFDCIVIAGDFSVLRIQMNLWRTK